MPTGPAPSQWQRMVKDPLKLLRTVATRLRGTKGTVAGGTPSNMLGSVAFESSGANPKNIAAHRNVRGMGMRQTQLMQKTQVTTALHGLKGHMMHCWPV